MRYDLKEPAPEPTLGDIKIVRKFLWLPKWTDNEIRWLEFANCQYKYESFLECSETGRMYYIYYWIFKGFVE